MIEKQSPLRFKRKTIIESIIVLQKAHSTQFSLQSDNTIR